MIYQSLIINSISTSLFPVCSSSPLNFLCPRPQDVCQGMIPVFCGRCMFKTRESSIERTPRDEPAPCR